MEIELPDGTVLDAPDDADPSKVAKAYLAKQKQPSMGDRALDFYKRGSQFNRDIKNVAFAGLRDLGQGGANLISLPGTIGVMGYNALTGSNMQTPAQAIDIALDEAGVPKTQNPYIRGVNQALGGGALGIAGGTIMAASQSPVVANVGRMLAAAPEQQLGGAIGGAVASQGAADMGAGPLMQSLAGIGGGVIGGGLLRQGVVEGIKRSFRGDEAGRQNLQGNIRLFEETTGRTPSVGQGTQNRRMQAAESFLARAPGGAGVMAREGRAMADDLSAGIEQQARKLSSSASPEQAGRMILREIGEDGGFVDKFKATQSGLYDKLDSYIPAQERVSLDNTLAALSKMNADIPGAPNTSRFFQNAKIKSVERALKSDLDLPTPSQVQLTAAEQRLADIDRARAFAMQDAGRFSAFANDQATRANNYFPVKGMPRVPGSVTNFPDRSAAGLAAAEDARNIARARLSEARTVEDSIASLRDAVDAETGRLPYEALKKLRTLVGNEMAESGIMSDVPRSKWKALYAALSRDLEGAAAQAGPDARQAWSRANTFTKVGMARLESISHVLDKAGGPEKVYRAALSGTDDGATTLRAVMQSLPKEGQKTLSATVLRRLGRATAGAQNDAGDVFSTETFLTNWNKMSPQAKATLFDRYGPGFRADMDRIAKVSANLRDGSQVFRNPSGTAQAAALTAGVAGVVGSAAAGQIGTTALILTGIAANNGAARLLTHPPFVKWLATTTTRPVGALPSALNQLAQSKDPVLQEAGALLSSQQANQPQQ